MACMCVEQTWNEEQDCDKEAKSASVWRYNPAIVRKRSHMEDIRPPRQSGRDNGSAMGAMARPAA